MHSPQNSKPQPPNSQASPTSDRVWRIRFCIIVTLISGSVATLITQLQSQPSMLAKVPQTVTSPSVKPVPQPIKNPTPQPEAVMGKVKPQQFSIPPSLHHQPSPSIAATPTPIISETEDPQTIQNTPSAPISPPEKPTNHQPIQPIKSEVNPIKFEDSSEPLPTANILPETLTIVQNSAEDIQPINSAEPLKIEITETVGAQRLRPNTIELTLREVVILALENNRTIKNQYLERIIQQQDLIVAEDKFAPDFTPNISLEWDSLEQGDITSVTNGLSLAARVVMLLPTGGEINLGWEGRGEQRDGPGFDDSDNDGLRQNLELSVRQPLLRNGGIEVNRASIEIARIDDKINILDLKSTLINQITEAIFAYRQLIQAQERLQIEISSLEIARQQVENTQVLIDAGRRARVDIVPVQARVANQEVSLLEAENNLKQQQFDLLEILDIDPSLTIIAADIQPVTPESLESENIKILALENRPDYLIAKLNIEQADFALKIAENQRKWNMDLEASVSHDPAPNFIEDRTEFRAGLNLTKNLGDRRIEREFKQRQVELLQAENNLDEEIQQVEIDVENSIRDVRENLRRVELARRATELAEEQLLNEEERVRLGVGNTSIVDLVQFQEALGQARNDELNANIDYLNSITNLEQTIGITLDAWDIIIETE
ncbi:MAG: TolC family protein [Microcoleaceae cyanobacterium]